ncbi:MAG: fumarylacetoacetate hydrolase [Candidatus Binatia bacterium]|nr:MAG: fumarylacetoacetate hydrolase [Candidatus Binatia bacterium]
MSVRLINRAGRACLWLDHGFVDLEHGSHGRFPSNPMDAVHRWFEVAEWAAGLSPGAVEGPVTEEQLGPPVPRPSKVFGIGLNYRDHAAEAGLPIPDIPLVFTKFPNCLVGPRHPIELSSDYVDWEVELVVVIGRHGRGIRAEHALDYIAGFTVGQDISDRKAQFAGNPPQFSLGKSYDTFGPLGPAIVSLDSFANPNDLQLTCEVSGERMQDSRTREMIFSVPELVEFLSRRCTLEPGDLIFTGTPAGVGSTRKPRRYLRPGDVIRSWIEGVGELVNECVGELAPLPAS